MVQVVQQWLSHTGQAKYAIFVQSTNLSSADLVLKALRIPGELAFHLE